jgi:hypothetical protein
MERVKGIEPSYSAWKSGDGSDIFGVFGPLRSLQNFALSEWRLVALARPFQAICCPLSPPTYGLYRISPRNRDHRKPPRSVPATSAPSNRIACSIASGDSGSAPICNTYPSDHVGRDRITERAPSQFIRRHPNRLSVGSPFEATDQTFGVEIDVAVLMERPSAARSTSPNFC